MDGTTGQHEVYVPLRSIYMRTTRKTVVDISEKERRLPNNCSRNRFPFSLNKSNNQVSRKKHVKIQVPPLDTYGAINRRTNHRNS
jgi:hypothetical protein